MQAWLLMCFLSFFAGSQASPSEPFRPSVVILDATIRGRISGVLYLDGDQDTRMDAPFAAYSDAIENLGKQVYQQMLDAGLKRTLELDDEEFYHGKAVDLEEAFQLHRQWKGEYVLGARQADALLAKWLEELRAILREDQLQRFEALPRLIRRLNLMRTPNTRIDFYRPVDLLELVRDARKPENELGWIDVDTVTADAVRVLEQARARLDSALLQYEMQLDTVLVDQVQLGRELPEVDEEVSFLTPIDSERKDLRKRTEIWRREYRLNEATVASIGALLEDFKGPAARMKWEDRYYSMLCPILTGKRWPDALVPWLEKRTDTTPEQRQSAEVLYSSYAAVRRDLRVRTIRAGAEAICDCGTLAGNTIVSSQFAYGRLATQLERLHNDFIPHFRAILSSEQVTVFNENLDAIRKYKGDFLVEEIDSRLRERLTGLPPDPSVLLPPIEPTTGARDPNYGKEEHVPNK